MAFARPVIAFALLRLSSETFHSDLLAGVSILIKPLIADLADKLYDSQLLASRMESAYGIPISSVVLDGFVPRLIAAGILIAEEGPSQHQRAVYNAIESIDAPTSEEDEYQAILDEFLLHARANLAGKGMSFTDQELISGFLTHLSTFDFSTIRTRPIVEPSSENTILGPEARQQKLLSQELASAATIDVLVASYITKLNAINPDRLILLSKVADGALGLELVLDLQAPQHVPRLENTTIIVDTPLALDYLDCSTNAAHSAAENLMSQIQQAGASLAIFQHSVAEAEGVITAVITASHSNTGAYGPSVHRRTNSAYRAYFDSLKGRIAPILNGTHHFQLIPKRAGQFDKNFPVVEEEMLADMLRTSITAKVQQREKDALSVAETIRLLGGKRIPATQVHQCNYIFMTSNELVRRRSAKFLKDKKFVDEDGFIPIITDRYVAGLCWMINGGKSADSPTTARLLANCARALTLRPELAAKTKGFLAQLSAEKALHFEAMMTNERASQYLMEVTYGNPDLITQNNCEEIYAEIERRAVEKIVKEKDDYYLDKIEELRKSEQISKEKLALLEGKLTESLAAASERGSNLEATKTQLNELQLKVSHGNSEVVDQGLKLDILTAQINALKLAAEQESERLKQQTIRIEKLSHQYANVWIIFIKIFAATTTVAISIALGYFDKFLLPFLDQVWQGRGNWLVILGQVAFLIFGFSIFTERIWGGFTERLRQRIFEKRRRKKLQEFAPDSMQVIQ